MTSVTCIVLQYIQYLLQYSINIQYKYKYKYKNKTETIKKYKNNLMIFYSM